MKNKEFYKLLKKNKFKSNSGFTLTELLVGLIMSIFVIGALGFGLMQVLRVTQSESSKVTARSENSRALDFISDEIRRARTIETDATNAGSDFNATDSDGNTKTVVLALDIPEISSSAIIPTTRRRIIYYLKSDGNNNWQGPQVLYRWGPPLNANGNFNLATTTGGVTTATAWVNQALIDGIDDTTVSSPCSSVTATPGSTVTPTPTTPQGFYACVTGSNTAQLYLTGQTKTVAGISNDTQTNDSRVVARARARLADGADDWSSIDWDTEGLGGAFGCTTSTNWDVRTDFSTPGATETTKWIQSSDTSKNTIDSQPQPITIDTEKDLNINSTAVNAAGCLNANMGNEGTDGSENLSDYAQTISHALDFGDPKTFNGDIDTSDGSTAYNTSQVITDDPRVQFLKKGYKVPLYGGYDVNNDGDLEDPGEQKSLGRFLYEKKIAIRVNSGDDLDNPNTEFIIPTPEQLASSSLSDTDKKLIRILGDDQRIIAFEMGHNNPTLANGDPNPGFDLQDNIFIVTSDIFKKKFDSTCFSSSGCSSSDTDAGSDPYSQ